MAQATVSIKAEFSASDVEQHNAEELRASPMQRHIDEPQQNIASCSNDLAEAPLQINVPTSVRAQKRRRLIPKEFHVSSLPEFAQEAQKKEQERLERLEKHKPTTSTSNYEPVHVNNERDEEDIVVDCVIKKSKQVEVVDLSSDDEETASNMNTMRVRMYRVRMEEEQRAKRVRRKSGALDELNFTPEGRLLVNEGHSGKEPDIFVASHLTQVLQPHQLGGVRFMFDNVVESVSNFDANSGFGCILAHSMGLGKTIQVVTFIEIFFRATKLKKALVISPVNVLQNWYNEFEKWLPIESGKRNFSVFVLGDAVKTLEARTETVAMWDRQGGVLLVGYEMFRMLTQAKKKKKPTNASDYELMMQEKMTEVCFKSMVDPGPDVVVCDEGHRIKNLKTECSVALNNIRTRRRIVLTGYPLQNNLMEYFCMVDFVRPDFLGDKKTFAIMFDKPIKNGMCIDSTPRDVKLARQRTHVLTRMLRGFVQRRTHHLLKKILPESKEYVIMLRKTTIQKDLYKRFLLFVRDQLSNDISFYNPLKAYAICSKIWNHPDLLFYAWKKQLEQVESNLQQKLSVFPNMIKANNTATSNSFMAYQDYGSSLSGLFDVSPFTTEAEDKKTKRAKKKPVSSSLLGVLDEDDNSVPYYWADEVMGSYQPSVLTNSHKVVVALTLIEATVIRGEKILLFSGSLLTLNLIEEFLKCRGVVNTPCGQMTWKRNDTYFRFDGSTSGADREKLIHRFNSEPNVHLFLISTRAGSLGVNLVSACRVIIFDASWNPCHDAQAVCRIYRYGQQNKTFIYRLVMDNCMERAIFSRQISKHGLQQRVVDEQQIDAKVTTKELENLIAYDERLDCDRDHHDLGSWSERIEDDLLRDIALSEPRIFSECPFLHESMMFEREDGLSLEEKMEAELLYEREKNNIDHATRAPRPEPFLPPPLVNPYGYEFGKPSNVPFSFDGRPVPLMNQPITVQHFLNNMNRPQPSTFETPTVEPLIQPGPLPRELVISSQQPFLNNVAPTPIMARPQGQTTPVSFAADQLTANKIKTNIITKNMRAFIQEDITLHSVNKPGTEVTLRRGDPVLLVRTKTGGVYLRTSAGQIVDAANTIYADPLFHQSEEVIELD